MFKQILVAACFLVTSLVRAGEFRKFEGVLDKKSPPTAAIAIQKTYTMFSAAQLEELKKEPAKILEYGLGNWIEANWLGSEDSQLYAWFLKNGIKVRSSMSLFVIRGFEFRLAGKKINIAKELRKPSWNRLPPPPPPVPSERPDR